MEWSYARALPAPCWRHAIPQSVRPVSDFTGMGPFILVALGTDRIYGRGGCPSWRSGGRSEFLEVSGNEHVNAI